MKRRVLLAALAGAAAASCSTTARMPANAEGRSFHAFVDRFFAEYYRLRPVEATGVGFHAHDAELGDYDASAWAARAAHLRAAIAELDGFPLATLDDASRVEKRILTGRLQDQLSAIEEEAGWKKNPVVYNDILTRAFLPLIERPFAPMSQRLRSVVARERQVPRMLEAARDNIDGASKPFVETAIEQLQSTLSMFREAIPNAFAGTAATDALGELKTTNAAAIEALEGFIQFLQQSVLPKASPDFAWGRELLERKLAAVEMVTTPLTEMEQIGEDRLVELQTDFVATAHAIDPRRTPATVLDSLARDHPRAEDLIPAVRGLLEELRTFCTRKGIITIPSEVRCEVAETPPFGRSLSLGALDAPGLYEPAPHEAYLKITLPDPSWPARRQEEHLRFWNNAALPSNVAFEAYPGRYLHYLWLKSVPTKVGRLMTSEFFTLGWSHYAEQLVLDEGYRSAELRVRLAQQRNALLRLARFLTAIRLHTGRLTPPEAIQFFAREAYQEPASAERETRRSISDPMRAMAYAWGKIQIRQLRQDYEKLKGNSFSLREFHDSLLGQGAPPLAVLRDRMLR